MGLGWQNRTSNSKKQIKPKHFLEFTNANKTVLLNIYRKKPCFCQSRFGRTTLRGAAGANCKLTAVCQLRGDARLHGRMSAPHSCTCTAARRRVLSRCKSNRRCEVVLQARLQLLAFLVCMLLLNSAQVTCKVMRAQEEFFALHVPSGRWESLDLQGDSPG